MDIARTGMSDPSEPGSVVVASEVIVPFIPTLSLAASSRQIILTLTAPNTKVNGDALHNFSKFGIYHSTGSGIDVDNDATYDGVLYDSATSVPFPCAAETYFRVTALDTFGNESAPCAEDSETPDPAGGVTAPEDDGLWAHRLGAASAWTEDSPDTDSVAWANVLLYWKDTKYTITGGNTDKKYIWWDYSLSTTTFQVSDTAPTLTFEDVIVAYNDAGKIYLTMYSPMVIADFLRAGILQSTNWAAAVGSQFDLDNGTITIGGSVSPTFNVGADGSFYLGGVAGNLQWTPSPVSLIVTATYASAAAGNERIAINDTTAHLEAIDSSNRTRIDLHSEDITLFDATPTLIAHIPTTSGVTRATNPYFVHAQVTIDNKLVVGSSAIDNPSETLHVTGDQKLTGSLDVDTNLNVDGYIEVGDHSTPTSARAVGIVYGTGSAPTANTTPIGTLFVKYTA